MSEVHQLPDGRQLVLLSERSAELRSLSGAHVCYLRAEAVTVYPTMTEQRLHANNAPVPEAMLPGVASFIDRYGADKHRELRSRFRL